MTSRPRVSFYAAPDIQQWLEHEAATRRISVCELVKRIVERAAEEKKK